MIRLAAAVLLTACLAAAGPGARADSFTPEQRAEIVRILREALRTDPTILSEAVEAMQADTGRRQEAATRSALAAQRTALEANPADPVAGNPAGDITIVEFYDTRCPYCRKLDPEMEALLAQDGGVRLVFKDIPILGPASVLGARAALAAQRQGGYLALRGALMHATLPPTMETIRAEATRLGLNADQLARDMDDPAVAARIAANLALAHTLGIQGTPALVVGGTLIPGAVELAELKQTVALARAVR